MIELKRYNTCNYSEFDTAKNGEWMKSSEVIEVLKERDKRINELEIENKQLKAELHIYECGTNNICDFARITLGVMADHIDKIRCVTKDENR